MQIEQFGELELVYLTIVRDGNSKKMRGQYIGLYGIPSRGGCYWCANNGDWGYCDSEEEAQREIWSAWKRETGIEHTSLKAVSDPKVID